MSRRQEHVDQLVNKVIVARLSRPDALELLGSTQADDQVSAALGEAAEKRARLESFYDSAAAAELTPTAVARIEARLIPEIEAAERYAREMTVAPVLKEVASRGDIGNRWHELPITVRREVIRLLMTIRILPAIRGARTFDPDTVKIEWRAA